MREQLASIGHDYLDRERVGPWSAAPPRPHVPLAALRGVVCPARQGTITGNARGRTLREIGVRPRFVSYPAGEYDQQTTDIFHSANYWAGLTTVQGSTHHSDDLFQLHRVRVRGTTTPEELLRLLGLEW